RVQGAVDVAALRRALDELVRRHEALRTTIPAHEGEARQLVHAPAPADFEVWDLTSVAPSERPTEVERRARDEAALPFDLAVGPLLRTRLLRLDDTEHVLLMNVHHAVADAWSATVMVGELATLYATPEGARSPLPELPLQYADYAEWQREVMEGEAA